MPLGWAVEEAPSPSSRWSLSALPCPRSVPQEADPWDGITGLDSGAGEGQGGQQERSVGEKVERGCAGPAFMLDFLLWGQ